MVLVQHSEVELVRPPVLVRGLALTEVSGIRTAHDGTALVALVDVPDVGLVRGFGWWCVYLLVGHWRSLVSAGSDGVRFPQPGVVRRPSGRGSVVSCADGVQSR